MRPAAQLQATIELLDLIKESKYPADRIMAKYFREHRYIGSKDKFVISEQFYAILRQRLGLSYLLNKHNLSHSSRNMAALLIHRQERSIADYFNGEKYSPVALHQGDIDSLRGIDFAELEHAPEHVKLNVPEWIAPRLKAVLGDSFEDEMSAINQRASTDIRVNLIKSNIQQVSELIKKNDYDFSLSKISAWGLSFQQRVALFNLEEFKQGWFEVQDQGSQLLAQLTAVRPGERVVDFCAGAGGKTLAMAAMMQNKGVIYACDLHTKRLDNLRKRVKRAGVHNVRVHVLSTEKDKWVKQQKGKADLVLIDAPCTGTGTWRRSPDSRWNLRPEDLDELIELQRSILQSASRLVRPGGRLVYATCSILMEENESQTQLFLAENTHFKAEDFLLSEPLLSNPGRVKHRGHEIRTLPGLSGCDGFYACSLTRESA
ncbi:MAG: RsmB/NOP family class I SAM-dependent RNA methyltransferase [Acidiferrobacterales bacterium]|nr:RsmB/NOP family class I SAM-dependent RNA methyltransferase [Acidiferrobacterales bacterium]